MIKTWCCVLFGRGRLDHIKMSRKTRGTSDMNGFKKYLFRTDYLGHQNDVSSAVTLAA